MRVVQQAAHHLKGGVVCSFLAGPRTDPRRPPHTNMRTGGHTMKRSIRKLFFAPLVMVTLAITAPVLWSVPFSQSSIIIEVNSTAGDAGIQIFLDAEGWKTLEISDPTGQRIFNVNARG